MGVDQGCQNNNNNGIIDAENKVLNALYASKTQSIQSKIGLKNVK